MFIRQAKIRRGGKIYVYHRLIESVRTAQGPRQRLVMSLGTLDLPKSEWPLLAERIEDFLRHQQRIPFGSYQLDERALEYAERIRDKQLRNAAKTAPRGETKEVYVTESESEQVRELGLEYVADCLWRELGLDRILAGVGFSEKQCRLAEIEVIGRLVAPRSELGTVSWFGRTALGEIMDTRPGTLNEDKLYRLSDRLHRNREAIEAKLAARERELFSLDETIVLYDLTSTYFEGEAGGNEKAERGYSRDHHPAEKQVVVGLVLDGDGFPKAHEVFRGNTRDRDTLGAILDALENRLGTTGGATVVVDRGLSSEENLTLIRERGHHYIVTTRQRERGEIFPEVEPEQFRPVKHDRHAQVSVSAQVQRRGDEVFVLCHSSGREAKDRAIRERFATRFEEDAQRLSARVAAGRLKDPEKINQAIGRLKERYPRVARYYAVELHTDATGAPQVQWSRRDDAVEAAAERDGTYLIRTDRSDLSEEQIWKLYVTLSRIERSFRYLKSELGLRPVFHQTTARVEGHIFISLLAYHLLRVIERRLGDQGDRRSWPTIRDILSTHQMVTIVHQCTDGSVVRLRKASTPEQVHREIYSRLGLSPPRITRKGQS